MIRWLIVGAVAAAVAVPTALAKPGAGVQLDVLPLPASAIGPAAKALPIQPDSGRTPNGLTRRGIYLTPTHSLNGSPPQVWAKAGRITGYALDYGLGASGGTGVTEVWTSVDEYMTGADANKGLAVWKGVDAQIAHFNGGGLAVGHQTEKVPVVGSRRFAFFVGFSATNIAPVFGLDEQFTEGRYEADVTVWAGTAAAAQSLAPTLAKRLDARISQALVGRLHATPVELPARPKPGPPPGGPDLTALALQPSDLSGPATSLGPFYSVDPINPRALSTLVQGMNPAGPFDSVVQSIEWNPTANQASFVADLLASDFTNYSVDLSSVGDGARGAVENTSSTGDAAIILSSGQLDEYIFLDSQSATIQTSDVQNVAQKAAGYINAAGLGS